MINRKFRPMGWCACVAGAALGCYLISHSVAAERNNLAQVEREIAEARGDILSLETELETRGRLSQLERWNSDVFALAAPTTRQFLEGGFDLAALYGVEEPVVDSRVEVRQASATVVARPPDRQDRAARVATRAAPAKVATPAPTLRQAVYPAPVDILPPSAFQRVSFLDDSFSGEIAARAEGESAPRE